MEAAGWFFLLISFCSLQFLLGGKCLANAEVGEPLNVGFFALKPDKRLFQASLTLGGRGCQL